MSNMTNGLLSANIRLNICSFPHIVHVLGSPSSYMTLQPIPSEFPYIEKNFVSFFISVMAATRCSGSVY
jgi:hypothetical protein